MKHTEQWIWLASDKYGNEPHNILSGFENTEDSEFVVAEFLKDLEFTQKIISAKLRFSGDCSFQLFCNDEIVATGPACVGGDFIGNETPRENFYAFETEISPKISSYGPSNGREGSYRPCPGSHQVPVQKWWGGS